MKEPLLEDPYANINKQGKVQVERSGTQSRYYQNQSLAQVDLHETLFPSMLWHALLKKTK